jgi:hypothetical protein
LNPLVNIVSQVDGAGSAALKMATSVHTNLYGPDAKYGIDNAAMPLEKVEPKYNDEFKRTGLGRSRDFRTTDAAKVKVDALFSRRQFPGGPSTIGDARHFTAKEVFPNLKGIKNRAKPAVMPDMIVHPDENQETGLVEDETLNDQNQNLVYVPFMFQDLRDNPPSFLYFNAFLHPDISETFTPDWQIERYYGRVDQVPTYIGTIRTIVLSFDIVAFKPQDLPMMLVKMHKLKSMVYPEFDTFGFLNKSPMIRMRVGDLFSGGKKRGLPGYITSLDFAYDSVWNTSDGFAIPRKVTVSLAFNVVHDGNPGIYPYAKASLAPDGTFTADTTRTFGAGKFKTDSDGITEVENLESEINGVLTDSRKELKKK